MQLEETLTWNLAFFLGTLSYALTCLSTAFSLALISGLSMASLTFFSQEKFQVRFKKARTQTPLSLLHPTDGDPFCASHLNPLLLLQVSFRCLRFKSFASILLIFTDAFNVVLVVIAPVHRETPEHEWNCKAMWMASKQEQWEGRKHSPLPEIFSTVDAGQDLAAPAHVHMFINLSFLQGLSASVTGEKHHFLTPLIDPDDPNSKQTRCNPHATPLCPQG